MGQYFSKSSIFSTVCYIPVWFTKTLNATDANKYLQSFLVCLSQVDVYQIFLVFLFNKQLLFHHVYWICNEAITYNDCNWTRTQNPLVENQMVECSFKN